MTKDGRAGPGIPRAPRPASVAVAKRRGRYVVDVSVSEAGGRKRYRQKFERKAEAEAHANAIRARLRDGLPPFETAAEACPSFKHADALALYEAEHVNGEKVVRRSREKMIAQREMIERHSLAKIEAEAATLEDLLAYRKDRKAAAKRAVSDATIAKDFKHLRAALRHAKRRKRVAFHVFERMDPEDSRQLMPAWRPEDTAGRVVSQEEQARLFAALSPDARRMAQFLAASGVRKMEAAALDWVAHFKHIPFPHFSPIVQKKSKARKIPFESVAGIVGPKQSGGLVFRELGATAEEIYARFTTCWRYAERKSKVRARTHDLRHTFGSAARRDSSLEDVAAVLGISAATAKTYADHEKDDLTRKIFGKLGTNAARLAGGAVSESNK
jgi:integrase